MRERMLRSNVWNAGGGSFFGNYAPPTYARGGHGGGHGGHGGHAVKGRVLPRRATLKVGTLVSALAVDVVTYVGARPRADTRAMQARAYSWNGGRNWGGRNWEAVTGIRS